MATEVVGEEWPVLVSMLAADLEQTARETGALVRRRGVPSAEALLRLAMAYAYVGLSLRATALWAKEAAVADLSDVALLNRLRHAAPWLARLLTEQLATRAPLPTLGEGAPAGGRVRLMDATYVCEPGSVGTDWRVHLGFDLARLCLDTVEVTDASGGETFTRLPVTPGDLVVGDRGYAHRRGIHAVVQAGGEVLVRLNWQNLPLQHADGTPFDLLAALRNLGRGEVGEWEGQTAPDPAEALPAVAGRLVAVQKSEAAAEAARRKARRQARKKGKTPDARTLEAAGYVFLFTTVAAARLTGAEVLALYRFRWQVELAFKRLKGLLGLGALVAHGPALSRTFLVTKLLGSVLVEDRTQRGQAFSPWGYGFPPRRALAAVSGGGTHLAPSDRGRPAARLRAGTRARPGAGTPRATSPPVQ